MESKAYDSTQHSTIRYDCGTVEDHHEARSSLGYRPLATFEETLEHEGSGSIHVAPALNAFGLTDCTP